MSDGALFMAGIRMLPRRSLSRAAGRAVQLNSAMAARRFAARYDIDLSDAEQAEYPSIHTLFTRRLKPGARPVDPAPEVLVSPVDGALSSCGDVAGGPLPQAKGREYTVEALLADPERAARFSAGSHFTIYLSPKDYHRIHTPVDGRVTAWTHVPGDLFPVNEASVRHVDQLFARNERLISHLETERFGQVVVVKVGATIVGRVRASYAPEIHTNLPGVRAPRSAEVDVPVARGDELGVFEMGSTVVVLTERRLRFTTEPGASMRMGERLAVVEG